MDKEMRLIEENGTYELVTPPPNANILDSCWVFCIKTNLNGTLAHHKARLVVRGFQQVEGVDYSETYMPVIKFTTIRMLLAWAATHKWYAHQMDVEMAFLNGQLMTTVHMYPLDGYCNDGCNGKVWKLNRSLYGLKQSPLEWY
jgi:hypothetical protein